MYMYYIYGKRGRVSNQYDIYIYIDIEIGMQPGYHDYNGYTYIYIYMYTLILEWGYNGDTVGWIYRQPFTRFVMAHADI